MCKVNNFKKIIVGVYPNSKEEKDLWKKIDAWEEVLGFIRDGSIINIDKTKPGKGDYNWYSLDFPNYTHACQIYSSLNVSLVAQVDGKLSIEQLIELLSNKNLDILPKENPKSILKIKHNKSL